jgi:phosphatidylserine decarboxylase
VTLPGNGAARAPFPWRDSHAHFVTIDRAAFPFVAVAALPAACGLWLGHEAIASALLILPVAVALFFRDPERLSPEDPNLVLAPADGTVTYAGEGRAAEVPPGRWRQITIFLSVFDVHINRSPVAGLVTRTDYHPGTFLPAYRPESHGNERSEIWLDHDGTVLVVRQVVGILARRVVCRVKAGDRLAAGARIGLMKFGSRMDVFVPDTARVVVKAGDTVRAGVTVIATLERMQA